VLENQINLGGRLCRMVTECGAGTAVIRLYGEFDLTCEKAFEEELRSLLDSETSSVIVDLQELDFIDSTGLGALLSLDNLARQDGFEFTVVYGNGEVRRVLRETGLDGVLPLVDRSGVVPTPDSPV
jgi:anti-anti-sigma factor